VSLAAELSQPLRHVNRSQQVRAPLLSHRNVLFNGVLVEELLRLDDR
jgi:hypothetical protein